MADKRLISEIGQFQTDQLQDGHRITVENAESNLDPEATAESKAESKELKNEGNIFMKQGKHFEELINYIKAIQLDDQNAAYYCNRAAIHIELGNHDLAIKECHTALSIDPLCSNAYDRLGLIFRIQKKYHEALANYTKAIQLDDHNVEYYIGRAIVHEKLGNHALAIKDCQTALSINPMFSETYNLLGSIFSNQKEQHEALANLTKAIQLDNHIVVYYYNRAIVHTKLDNDALAIKDFHTALSIDPSFSNVYAELGHIFMKQEKYQEALANYTKAIQLNDHIAVYYCNTAVVHKKLGNDALAIKDYHTALSIDPSFSNAYAELGCILVKQEKYQEALANYTKAIQLDDHNVAYYIGKAIVHEKLGNHALAIKDCRTALSINPMFSETYNLLGGILSDQKEHHEALANLTKAIELDDHNAVYYCNRAIAYAKFGNDALAIKDCHTAFSIDPSYSNAYTQLGHIFMKQGNHHEALANYTKAIELDDHNVVYYCNRAIAYTKFGNDALAIKDYHTALSIDPSHNNAYTQLGYILMKQKKHHEALAHYTKAIQLDNHNVEYYLIRAIVHEKLGNNALAITDYQTARSIDPSYTDTYKGLTYIRALVDQKEYHKALDNYEKLIQSDNVVAIHHTKLDNPVLTLKDSLKALAIDPSNSEAYTRLSLAFRNLDVRLRKNPKRL